MGKPNMGLDFTYYLCITWYRACAMHILTTNMEISGPLNIYGTVLYVETSYLLGIFITKLAKARIFAFGVCTRLC